MIRLGVKININKNKNTSCEAITIVMEKVFLKLSSNNNTTL